jgi:CRISPR-associated protein Cst1
MYGTMETIAKTQKEAKKKNANVVRVYLSDWLFNAGILGFMKILSINKNGGISDEIHIGDDGTYIEFTRDSLDGFTNKFFETAFQFHGKYDSIKRWLEETKNYVDAYGHKKDIAPLAKRLKIEDPDEEKVVKALVNETSKIWKGVAYEFFHKIKKSDIDGPRKIKQLIDDLLHTLRAQRGYFVEKEVQTFLRRIIGSGSFLNKSVEKNQKDTFKRDFESPILSESNQENKKLNCIHCNSRKAKKNTIFSTGLVFYQGLNKDSVNFVWGFDPDLPLCEICELIYFCHWAGFTKGFRPDSYLFVNDDSDIHQLWKKNHLITQELKKDGKENVLINYFYELLAQEEKIKSTLVLQNISIIEVDLQNKIMPKVISLHISRAKAQYIKDNHEMLKWQSKRFYKIKDDYINILRGFLNLLLADKLNYHFIHRLLKYYLQSRDETKSFVTVNYNPSNLLHIVVLINKYFKAVKQKETNMDAKFIWHIYHLGNDMRRLLTEQKAQNKINGIAYRLLNAVRSNDQGTFLNVLLRHYIGYNKEVPKGLVNTLENDEKFQVIGLSYINGLLGEPLSEKQTKTE